MFCSAIKTVSPVPRNCRNNSPIRCTMIGTSGIMAQTPDLLDAFASVIPQSKETTPARGAH
jgi:hypothetical protein